VVILNGVKYPHLFLKEWPFQIVPSPTFYKIWAGRNEIKQTLIKMFERVQQRNPSLIYLLWGYFGAGKTHSLRYFQWKLSNDKIFPTLVGYHEFPVSAKKFIDVYQGFITSINFHEIERVAKIVCEHLHEKHGDNVIKQINDEISHYNGDFTNAVISLANNKETAIIRRWICAEKVYLTDLRKASIEKRIEKDEDVFNLLGCLVRLLTYKCDELPTFKSIIWMIDDFHEIEALKESYRDVIRHGLTSIFNSCPEHFCLVLAFTSRSITVVKGLLSESLLERLPLASLVSIPPMTKEEAREFILDLLRQFRPEEKPPDEYYPFSLEAINDIIDFTAKRGVLLPRNIMTSFDVVLNKAEELIKNGLLKQIDSSFALKILAKTEVL
jgi:hypothetical protein